MNRRNKNKEEVINQDLWSLQQYFDTMPKVKYTTISYSSPMTKKYYKNNY